MKNLKLMNNIIIKVGMFEIKQNKNLKTLNDIDMLICMICIGYIKKPQGVSQRPERKKKTEL